MKHPSYERKMSKKEKRNRLLLRIFTLFLIAMLLAGTFYYVIVFTAQMLA